ncbi:hypothetical protein ACN42_g10804 [Penicillium freii]|uniref:Reverse transcriptase zinc-binding domain-containing protein n=1 Tax=Penicillium freii TaxID=48697 RepID=A0A101M9D5_PENFR|nr:hypothetical protein ACN42_g10804 [Penicillium freii]
MRLWTNTQKKQPKNRTAHKTLSSVVYASQPQRNGEVAENLEWDRTWAKETTSRPTRRLIEAPTKSTLEYWSGLRKATTSILMQLRTGRIGLGAYLNRINRRETARCGCDLGNQTVIHVLLECQDERDWMRSAVSDKGIALSRDELLTRPGARTVVAEFMVKAPPARPISDSRPCGSGRGRGRQRSGDNDPLNSVMEEEGWRPLEVQCQVHSTLLIQASAQAAADKTGRLERRGRGNGVR